MKSMKVLMITSAICAFAAAGCATNEVSETTERVETTFTTEPTTESTNETTTKSIETTQETETTTIIETTANQPEPTASVENYVTVNYPDSASIVKTLKEAAASSNDENLQRYANVTEWRFVDLGEGVWVGKSVGDTLDLGIVRKGNEFVIDSNPLNERMCSNCNGLGFLPESKDYTCNICGGTGQQYIQFAYHDVYTGWHGQWQVCSGCGGQGHTSEFTGEAVPCGNCNGIGYLAR